MGKNYGSGVIIESGASYFIDDGDRITAPTVNYNGRLIVGSGGTALEIRENGGYVAIASGALVTFVPNAFSHLDLTTDQASWRQSTTVHSGTTANNTNIYSDYHLRIHNGGTANYTSIHRLGHLEVFGGIANHTTIDSLGGFLVIYDGATANNTVIEQGAGSMTIQSGGVANNTDDGGDLYVYGKANETNIYRKMFVCENGEANDTNVLSGGRLYVSSGGVVNRTTVSSGSMFVELGGVANSVNVISRGRLTVSVGGQVNYATIDRTGAVFLEAGGDANDVTVSSGGYLDISDGATASGIVVSSGGHLLFDVAPGNNVQGTKGGKTFEMKNGALSNYTVTRDTDSAGNTFALLVFSGGVASRTTVTSYGSMIVSADGVANATTVSDGGNMVVYEGAVVNSTTVKPSGYLTLLSGASANYTVFSSSIFTVGDSMTLNNTTVKDGYLNVSSNGYANVTVLSNGSMSVSDGGVATETTVKNGCILDVGATGLVTNTIVNSGGSMEVIGSANMTTVKNGGMLDVLAGGAVNGTILSSGGSARISGNAANTTVNQSGSDVDAVLTICDGGKATRTTVNDRGYAIVSSGGQATSTTINYGEMTLLGGTAKSTTVNSGGRLTVSAGGTTMYSLISSGGILDVSSGGMTTATTLNDGAMYLSGGATLHSADVNSGGYLYIYSGAITDQIYEGGGYVDVQKGAEANFASTTFNKKVFSRASATVHSGTTARIITLEHLGLLRVFSGGRVVAVTVSSGGDLYLSGGFASGTTVSAGGSVCVSSGATVAGQTYIEDGARIRAYDGSILDFNLAHTNLTSALTKPIVNDLTRIDGTPIYAITVSASPEYGTYMLAGGAAGFDKTITVKSDSTGEALGTLAVGGGTTTIGGVDYTLNLGGDNVLSVTVGAAVAAGLAKSDIDGNGISDVMFIWTGTPEQPGNYQHGYWMNGTNEWQSANSSHPAEWDNLGCYDMTGDGKADSVLFGNVTSEAGIKGAYIGYYADAIDLPDGSTWVNIGYLNNADEIAWKNKVGNLTGGSANSIVWYAPDLYALGAWTDGTENWVTLSNTFGGSAWTLVGCGDFTGDGKDQVVMALNGGELYYEVGIDGAASELTKSDSGWEVRAIGDFKGDGKDDIVAFHKETGLVAMWGDGNSANWSKLGQLDAKDWFVVGCGDYNGDAKDDLLVRQYSTGMLGYYSSGDMGSWTELGRGVDMNWTVIA